MCVFNIVDFCHCSGLTFREALSPHSKLRRTKSSAHCFLAQRSKVKGYIFVLICLIHKAQSKFWIFICLVPVPLSPRPSRSIDFGDVSKTNGPEQPRSQGTLSTSRKYPGYGWSRVC